MGDKRHCSVCACVCVRGFVEEAVARDTVYQSGDPSPSVSLIVTWLSHTLIPFTSLLSGKRSERRWKVLHTRPSVCSSPLPSVRRGQMDGLGVRMSTREEACSIYQLITPSVKERLEVTQERRGTHTRHTHSHTKAKVLWALGALPLCPISPGVLLRLQLYWAGTIPSVCVCECAIYGVCLMVSLSEKLHQ